MKYSISARGLANPNHACGHWPHHCHSLFGCIVLSNVKNPMLIKWSYHPPFQYCWLLGLEWLVYSQHVVQSISSKYMFFWCLFLDPHPTIYHSNIGVQIIPMLLYISTSTLKVDNHYSTTFFIRISIFEWYVVWCSLKMNIKKTCSKYDSHSTLNNQHHWSDPYDHSMSTKISTLIMSKKFIEASKNYEESGYMWARDWAHMNC